MAVTIQDVARQAGVSKAAVSYVLNGRSTAVKITEATKERVWKAVQELGYHPNALARGLARKRTDTIRLLLPDASNFSVLSGFTGELLQGLSETALQLGYDLLLHTREVKDPVQDAAAVTDGRADGALMLREPNDPLIPLLTARQFPFVLMFCQDPDGMAWSVDCDNVEGARLATTYLLFMGHRHILYVTGSRENSAAMERQIGYRQALLAQGLPPEAAHILEVDWEGGTEEQYRQIEQVLRSNKRPTAVFCWCDGVAARLLRMARELGLRVPPDLSIIGFDSTALCDHTEPPLTSIRQPIREMAGESLHLLAQRLNGEEVQEIHRRIRPALVRRASCGPPRSHR